MKSKQDLVDLLNYCKPFLYGKNSFPISLAQLTFNANPKRRLERYKQFTIQKRSGSERVINSPNAGLKCIQRCLNMIFQVIYEPSIFATGFVPGKSILTNAAMHKGCNYVYNIDLKDFFGSVDQARIWGRLQNKPFNLNKGFGRLELANVISSLCCHEIEVERLNPEGKWVIIKKNVLPQGAPTSPTLTNIICQQLDYYLSAMARRFGINYSRYADDITFSSMHNVYHKGGEFINELKRIIGTQNFHIKEEKTRIQKSAYRQRVTGLIVNDNPNLPPKYRKTIKMWLYLWEIYGYDKATELFAKELKSPEQDHKGSTHLQSVLSGKLNFLKMVKGAEDQTYLKLKMKFDDLSKALKQQELKIENINVKEANDIKKQNSFELPILHKPRELVEILKMFTVDNSILKYATHTWDAGRDESRFESYEDFIKKAKIEFDKVNNVLQQLRPQLRAKILSFLFNKEVQHNGWGTMRIKFGWSSPELAEVMKTNPDTKPEELAIPIYARTFYKTYNGSSHTIQRFKQIIDIFKNEIELRDNNSALPNILLEYHDHYLPDFEIVSFQNLENKSFYTDVDYLRKVFIIIFESIAARKKTDFPNRLSYILDEAEQYYTLKIAHHDSFSRGLSKTDGKFSLTRGDFATIKSNLLNLCDWSIETEFLEGRFQLNFLTSDYLAPKDHQVDSCVGFTHIFRFYK